jgi:epoxyqueuosine reductase
MINSEEIKKYAGAAGVDLCGIANIERFHEAPEGYNPKDILKDCKSVIAFLKTMPDDLITIDNFVPYTRMTELLIFEIDNIGLKISRFLKSKGIKSIPVPCDSPYLYWDEEKKRGQGILSMRHTGYLAGLGILGKNTLLINRKFGNMIYIGAVLCDISLEPDPIVTDFTCPENCRKCLKTCPQNALDGITVDQYLCRENSMTVTKRGFQIYTCNKCRKACAYRKGVKEKYITNE